MSRLFSKLVMLIFIGSAPDGFTSDQTQDETAILRVEADLQDAWNRHDMKAWANLFSEEADFVNVAGWWWKGRAQIEKRHTDVHAFVFKESTLTINEVDIKFLTPNIALAHVRWSLVGDKNPDGTSRQPRKGIFTQVLQKQTGKWLIVAAQNTNSIPEETIPTAPPKR